MTTARTILWRPAIRRGDGPIWRAVVAALDADVAGGRLHPGDRLPTQRDLADALGIGLGTVTRAYREAERLGLVTGRVGRGTFVAAPPTTHDVLGLPDERRIEMSVDLPVHEADPDLGAALRKIARRPDVQRLLRYHDHVGTARHRQAGAVWLERFGVPTSPDHVVVCAGSQHAICVALLLATEPGDAVVCDELTYHGVRAVAGQLALRLHGVPADEDGMDPDAVASICRRHRVRALYCVPSAHNPTTTRLAPTRGDAIVRLAREHDFTIVEDDVHRLTAADPPTPLAVRAPERTIFIASFSKAVTAGVRVAFAAVPPALVAHASEAVWATVWMVSPLTVEVAATWIEDGTADAVVARKRAEAGRRQARCRAILGDWTYASHPNGYHAWLQLPPPWTSAGFVSAARARGVVLSPSGAFVVGSVAPPPAVRICLAAPERIDDVERGLAIVRDLLEAGPDASLSRG